MIAFDNLGSGKSSNIGKPLTMEIYADNCFEILEQLKIENAHVVGKSMGGMIAQVFAAKYSKKVKKLVLACTCSSRDRITQEIIDISQKIVSKVGMKEIQCFQAGLDAFRPFLVIFSAYDAPIGSEVV